MSSPPKQRRYLPIEWSFSFPQEMGWYTLSLPSTSWFCTFFCGRILFHFRIYPLDRRRACRCKLHLARCHCRPFLPGTSISNRWKDRERYSHCRSQGSWPALPVRGRKRWIAPRRTALKCHWWHNQRQARIWGITDPWLLDQVRTCNWQISEKRCNELCLTSTESLVCAVWYPWCKVFLTRFMTKTDRTQIYMSVMMRKFLVLVAGREKTTSWWTLSVFEDECIGWVFEMNLFEKSFLGTRNPRSRQKIAVGAVRIKVNCLRRINWVRSVEQSWDFLDYSIRLAEISVEGHTDNDNKARSSVLVRDLIFRARLSPIEIDCLRLEDNERTNLISPNVLIDRSRRKNCWNTKIRTMLNDTRRKLWRLGWKKGGRIKWIISRARFQIIL